MAMSLPGCWLQPGFDAGRTNWNRGESALNTTTVVGLTELWDTALPDVTEITAPLLVGDSVYASAVRTADPSGAGDRVFGLDAATGSIRWAAGVMVPGGVGYATETSAPAVHEDHLVVPYWIDGINGGGGGLVSVGFDGTVLEVPGTSPTTEVAVAGDQTASLRWSRLGSSGTFLAWVSWIYKPVVPSGGGFGPSPGDSFAIVGDRVAWSQGTEALGFSAACPEHPDPFITGCTPDWRTELGAMPAPAAAVGSGQIVYGDATGTVTVLDMVTGTVLWTAEVGAAVTQRAAVAGDTILVGTADGRVVALAAAGCGAAVCDPVWQATVASGATTAPPLVGGDVMYVTAGRDITAFPLAGCGAPDCPSLATVSAPETITGGPVVHDGRLIAGTQNGHVIAFGLPG